MTVEFSMSFPDTIGIHLSPEEDIVAILHRVGPFDRFNDAALAVFQFLKDTQAQFPDKPRHLFIEIEGHEGPQNGFDADFFEFQQDFLLGFLGVYFTGMHLPATGSLMNKEEQKNSMPERLDINE